MNKRKYICKYAIIKFYTTGCANYSCPYAHYKEQLELDDESIENILVNSLKYVCNIKPIDKQKFIDILYSRRNFNLKNLTYLELFNSKKIKYIGSDLSLCVHNKIYKNLSYEDFEAKKQQIELCKDKKIQEELEMEIMNYYYTRSYWGSLFVFIGLYLNIDCNCYNKYCTCYRGECIYSFCKHEKKILVVQLDLSKISVFE